VTSLRILGVIVNDKLTAADHVTMLLSSYSRMLYAMRVLREARRPRPCTTSSTPSSSRGLSMQLQRGLGCAQLLTARVSTHCCVAANGSATNINETDRNPKIQFKYDHYIEIFASKRLLDC